MILGIVIISMFLTGLPLLAVVFFIYLLTVDVTYFLVSYSTVSFYILFVTNKLQYMKSISYELSLTKEEKEMLYRYNYYVFDPIASKRLGSLSACIQAFALFVSLYLYMQQEYVFLGIVVVIGLYYTFAKMRVKFDPLWCWGDTLRKLFQMMNKGYGDIALKEIKKLSSQYETLLDVMDKYNEYVLKNLKKQVDQGKLSLRECETWKLRAEQQSKMRRDVFEDIIYMQENKRF